MKAYGIINAKGKLMNDFRGRIGFVTKKKAEEVNESWEGKIVQLKIIIKE